MTLDMANLGPRTTGIGAYIHVYQNLNHKARHGPRIKVFPSNPNEGDATIVAVPTKPGQDAKARGIVTVSGGVLRRALLFAKVNWAALSRYWLDATMTTEELLEILVSLDRLD